ncbi:MAG: hypothetical protein LBR87_03045, partial [Synergistaceae bacterium]|nr:hypothetical protein [Synergistaceae bacterium]
LQAGLNEKFLAGIDAELLQRRAAWKEEALKDPEYGGEKFDRNVSVINRGRDAVMTPAALKLFGDYGLDTHPEIARICYRAGRICGEDTSAAAPASGGGGSLADRMFAASLEGVNLPNADAEEFAASAARK